ncbi:MAG: HAD-superfamily hydrolase, subfamily variant 3 [Verrucomicrobiaceae bacterium]|nr:HAD-superfamily hydrolase, subfamily variant 3 [Verrucomicrobiaceae bacterium]
MPALLFDIGNVLVTFDFTRCAERMAEFSKLSPQAVIEAISPFKEPLESGQMHEAEFFRLCIEAIGFTGTHEEFCDIWSDIFTINLPMAETLAKLPRKLPAYLFSNTNDPHKRWLLEKFEVFKHFDGGLYSHEAGCMKPAEAFYQTAIERFGLKPNETFYVDDLEPNIATGQRLGFRCFLYDHKDHQPLHEALNTWVSSFPAQSYR